MSSEDWENEPPNERGRRQYYRRFRTRRRSRNAEVNIHLSESSQENSSSSNELDDPELRGMTSNSFKIILRVI